MVKILHYVSRMDRAGQETFIMNVFRNINRDKINFDFLCSSNGVGDYDGEIEKLGGNIYHLGKLNLKHFKFLALLVLLRKKMKILVKDHNIFEIHTQHAMDAFFSALIAKSVGFETVIVHSHNSNSLYHPKLHKIFKNLLHLLFLKRFACGVDAGEWMFGNDCFTIIKNGIDTREFMFSSEKRESVRNKNHWENQVVIGNVGRFNSQKNQIFAVKVFQEFTKLQKNSRLVFIGTGEDQEKIKNFVKNSSIEKKISFLGVRDDVSELYQGMDLFLMPSLFEGLPVTLVEAQASSLPCLVSNSITHDVKVTNRIKFENLSDSYKNWAENLRNLYFKYPSRVNEIENITKAGYSIRDVTIKLEDLYLNFNGDKK